MKQFWLGLSVGLAVSAFSIGYVFAQSKGLIIKSSETFTPVQFPDGKYTTGFFVGRIDLADGGSCFFLTNKTWSHGIDNLDQIRPLGCN